jgi:hypothetical protein
VATLGNENNEYINGHVSSGVGVGVIYVGVGVGVGSGVGVGVGVGSGVGVGVGVGSGVGVGGKGIQSLFVVQDPPKVNSNPHKFTSIAG